MGLLKLTDKKLSIKKLRQTFIDKCEEFLKNLEIIEWFFPISKEGKRPLSNKEINV